MKLYIAIAQPAHLKTAIALNCPHILVSYWYIKKKAVRSQVIGSSGIKWFLDSGAHTANTQGVTITVEELSDFILEHEQQFEVYAGLDDIRSWKRTQLNIRAMEKRGLHPLPTFHYGEPLKVLEEYLQEYEYVAIGGVVGKRPTEKRRWLEDIYARVISRYPSKKIHMFGVHERQLILRFPFYSADASSGSISAAVGIHQIGGRYMHYAEIARQRRNLEGFRILTNECNPDISLTEKSNLRFAGEVRHKIQLEKEITRIWEKRGIRWN